MCQGFAYLQPEEFRELYNVPDEELTLIVEPLLYIIEDSDPKAIQAAERQAKWFLLIFGIVMVFGVRWWKQYETISARKRQAKRMYDAGYASHHPDIQSQGNQSGNGQSTRPTGVSGLNQDWGAGGPWGSGTFGGNDASMAPKPPE